MNKKKYFLKWAIAFIAVLLLTTNVTINAEDPDHVFSYFLEGTILDGNTRVVVTEDGNPPRGLEPSLYDMVISFEERDYIIEQAKNEFIEMYGSYPAHLREVPSDAFPCPFEIHLFDGTIISSEELLTNETLAYYLINGLAEIVPIGPDFDHSCVVEQETTSGPHAIDGEMFLSIFLPMDTDHKPDDCPAAVVSTRTGWNKFQRFENLDTHLIEYWGIWDASDVGYSSSALLSDLKQDCSSYRLDDSYLLLGFVRYSDNNGRADRYGFYSIVAESAPLMQFTDHLIVTHELSHNIGGMGDTWFGHGRCYMEYFSLWLFDRLGFFFDEQWCDECYILIHSGIWHFS